MGNLRSLLNTMQLTNTTHGLRIERSPVCGESFNSTTKQGSCHMYKLAHRQLVYVVGPDHITGRERESERHGISGVGENGETFSGQNSRFPRADTHDHIILLFCTCSSLSLFLSQP